MPSYLLLNHIFDSLQGIECILKTEQLGFDRFIMLSFNYLVYKLHDVHISIFAKLSVICYDQNVFQLTLKANGFRKYLIS